MSKRFGRQSWLVLFLVFALALAACGGGEAETPTTGAAVTPTTGTSGATTPAPEATEEATEAAMETEEATEAPMETEEATEEATEAATGEATAEEFNPEDVADLSGEVLVDGSSTVFPITSAAAEEFRQYAPNVNVSVGVSGTGGGFERFCNDETDISDASRPIKEEEIQACEQKGIEYIELPVAYDGLSVMVSPENDFVDCLTVEELKKIWEPEAEGKVTSWNQIRPDFPDQPLSLYGPGTDSGTFDYFTDVIVGEEGASRGDYQASEDDNVLVQGVSGDPNALGYFGYAYYQANQDALKLVAVDGGSGCVEPSPETIASGEYAPLGRPIFIYVKKEAAERPEVEGFVNFYLSDTFTELIPTPEVGYVALSDDLYQALRERFANGVTGTEWADAEEGAELEDLYLGQ